MGKGWARAEPGVIMACNALLCIWLEVPGFREYGAESDVYRPFWVDAALFSRRNSPGERERAGGCPFRLACELHTQASSALLLLT